MQKHLWQQALILQCSTLRMAELHAGYLHHTVHATCGVACSAAKQSAPLQGPAQCHAGLHAPSLVQEHLALLLLGLLRTKQRYREREEANLLLVGAQLAAAHAPSCVSGTSSSCHHHLPESSAAPLAQWSHGSAAVDAESSSCGRAQGLPWLSAAMRGNVTTFSAQAQTGGNYPV